MAVPSALKSLSTVDTKYKWAAALVLALAFYFVSNPVTYQFVDQVFKAAGANGYILDAQGRVTQLGVLVHAVVFLLLARLLMVA